MRKSNRIAAMLLSATIIGSTIAIPTFASSIDDSDSFMTATNDKYVDINGYNCRLIDGEYVTVIDGEEYVVIELGNGNSDGISVCSFTPPWDVAEIDVSDGSEYKASVDLNLGDHKAIYHTGTNSPELSAYIGTGYWIPQTYHIEIYTFDNGLGWVKQVDKDETFGNGRKFLLTGTGAYVFEKFAIKFSADSRGQKEFNYWFGRAKR